MADGKLIAFVGGIGVMGHVLLSGVTPIESHRLVAQADGALNDTDNRSTATFLLGVDATSMRVVEDHIYPYPTVGVESREAALMVGAIVPAGSVNWETDGLIVSVVSQCNTTAVVAGSFFSVAAATGAVVWAQNWRVLDYDNFNEATNYAATLQGVEIDLAAANTATDTSGINLGIYLPATRTSYVQPQDAIRINTTGGYPGPTGADHLNYFSRGIWFYDGSCDIAMLVGLAPVTIGLNSQFINFRSGSGGSHLGKFYAASDGTFIIYPNTEMDGSFGHTPASIPLAIFRDGTVGDAVFAASDGFQIGVHGSTLTTVIDATTNIFGASLSIRPPFFIGLFHNYNVLGQQILDKNGNVQAVTTTGTGPVSEAAVTWGTTVGSTTITSAVHWICLGTPVVMSSARDFFANSLTIRSALVTGGSVLAIDSANTANFARLKIGGSVVVDAAFNANIEQLTVHGTITIDASRNTNFAFVTTVGVIVNGPTGGAAVGYVNVSNGYMVNGSTVINSSLQAILSSLQVGSGGATFSGVAVFAGSPFSVSAVTVNSNAYYIGGTAVIDAGRSILNVAGLSMTGILTNTGQINVNTFFSNALTINTTQIILHNNGQIEGQSLRIAGTNGGSASWVDSAGKTITFSNGMFVSRV